MGDPAAARHRAVEADEAAAIGAAAAEEGVNMDRRGAYRPVWAFLHCQVNGYERNVEWRLRQ